MRAFIVEHTVDFTATVRDPQTGEFVKAGAENVKTFANGFVIASHYCHTLAAYQEMIAWATARLPQIDPAAIELRTVAQSSWCKGCPIIRFPIPPGTMHPDFHTAMNDVREA